MGKFVNIDNTTHRPDKEYSGVIDAIQKDGVCPFCPEYLKTYHKNPILKEGTYWLLTENMYPYEGAKYHILIIHKKHIEKLEEVSSEAWVELKALVDGFLKEKSIPGGTLVMRFGDTAYTGASVSHLHLNIVSADGEDKERKPIVARVG